MLRDRSFPVKAETALKRIVVMRKCRGTYPGIFPPPEDEALRDLVRAREDSKQSLRRAKQQLGAFLLRRSLIYPGKTSWSKTHFNWLADITMKHPARQIVLQEYIDTICNCRERVNRITKRIHELSEQSRLCDRYRRLTGKGKKANVAKIAVARELVGFAWAVSREIPEAA